MAHPGDPFDWRGLWAGLLRGIGTGLLEHDGSRLAQAALAGLRVFDDVQELQRKPRGPAHHGQRAGGLPWPEMSAAEMAAFDRLTPDERAALLQEASEAGLTADHTRGAPMPDTASPPYRRRPLSANPLEGWLLETILPLDRDGRLNIPARRR